jgi:pantoate--beta-alanine ligase
MEIVSQIHELRDLRSSLPEPVGFIPTMGFLHEGHLSMVHRARQECASVVVSIFVNPAQFGPREDLAKYPRNLPRDQAQLESAGTDILWVPSPEIMYPPDYQTWVNIEKAALPLEGALRPGHFRGVATVVTKLFNVVQPDKAYFGQKDAQQVAVIRQMTKDLNFAVQIVVCPTIREPDGLAMSSRNTYLNVEERKAASVLFQSLSAAGAAFKEGEREAEKLRLLMKEILAGEALIRPQYVSCVDPLTLQELDIIQGEALLSMAVYIGETRLIDNFLLYQET